jgi:molybdopterin-guanine dinucleotide biosynthesis protein A
MAMDADDRSAGSRAVSGLVLVGGSSSRMGRNKALLPVGGVPLIERVVAALRPLATDILLMTNEPAPYAHLGLPCIPDEQPGYGPLMGLYSGLKAVRHEAVLLVACDMPFLNPALLARLVELLPGYDLVIPRTCLLSALHLFAGRSGGRCRRRAADDRLP